MVSVKDGLTRYLARLEAAGDPIQRLVPQGVGETRRWRFPLDCNPRMPYIMLAISGFLEGDSCPLSRRR